MLSAEAEERAKKRWMDMFDKVYPKCASMFRTDSTLVISRVDDLKTYGEDGLEYKLQVAPWESEDERSNEICELKERVDDAEGRLYEIEEAVELLKQTVW